MQEKEELGESIKMRNRKGLFLTGCLIFSCIALIYYLHLTGSISSGSGNNLGFFKRARYQYKPGEWGIFTRRKFVLGESE